MGSSQVAVIVLLILSSAASWSSPPSPSSTFVRQPPSTRLSAEGGFSLFKGLKQQLGAAFEADKTLKVPPGTSPSRDTRLGGGSGKIQAEQLVGTSWDVSWYLTGVPDGDVSSDLYGARVDISNSAEFDSELSAVLPAEPQVVTTVTLLEGGVCKCDSSEFTTGEDGEWKLVYEQSANLIRFSVCNLGFRKTTAMQGSLQNVFGGKDNEFTKSVRSIPEGKV